MIRFSCDIIFDTCCRDINKFRGFYKITQSSKIPNFIEVCKQHYLHIYCNLVIYIHAMYLQAESPLIGLLLLISNEYFNF